MSSPDEREKTILIPEPVKEAAGRTWHIWTLLAIAIVSLGPALWAAGNLYGPEIEGPPLASLDVVGAECRGSDLVANFRVNRRHGKFLGATFLGAYPDKPGPPFLLRHIPAHGGGGGLPRGRDTLTGPMLIEFGCGLIISIRIRHRSDWGWWTFRSEFGPFGPFGHREK